MSDNDYYKRTKEFDPRTRANGLDVEFELDAISAAFDKIPAPREDGQGYDGPIHVGEATAPTHAVQLQQMEAQLGDNTANANRAEEAAERAEEARDIAIEKARQSGEARDEALEAAATVTNIHREQLEKALGVNARVYPRLTNQNLKVGDVIPAPEETADGLPITHVIVDGNAYEMSSLVSGLVSSIGINTVTIGGVTIYVRHDSYKDKYEVKSCSALPQLSTNGLFCITVENTDAIGGNGQISTWRKTSSGWWLNERIITGQFSGSGIDASCPAWRQGFAFVTKNICFFKRALAGSSGQSVVNIINADWPAVEFGGEVSFPAYYLNAVGSYVRFATKERKIRVLIAGTQTTSQSVEISLIGGSGNVYRTETINPRTSQPGGTGKFKLFIAEFENLSDLTTVQVKQTDATAPAYVLGVNAEFNDLTSYDIDTKVHQNYADVNDTFRANASGAMNYAIQEASTSLFGGESHGGETVLSASFMLDTINYFPESGDVKVCATLTINQETLIDWGDGKTVGVKQSQRYRNGAVTEFTASFKPSIGFKAKQFYVGMLTNNNHFTDVTFPIVRNFPKGVVNQVELPKSNYFEVVSESGIYHNGISFEDFTANSVSQNFYYANAFGPQHNKFYTGYVSRIDNVYGQDVKEFSTRTCRFYY